jgi:hypothetical protein
LPEKIPIAGSSQIASATATAGVLIWPKPNKAIVAIAEYLNH